MARAIDDSTINIAMDIIIISSIIINMLTVELLSVDWRNVWHD